MSVTSALTLRRGRRGRLHWTDIASYAYLLLGVILMALILNGLNLLNINPYWQTIVVGGVLILTVAADALSRRRNTAA